MPKELSKQLCEIVGIKPRLEYNTNFSQVDYYDGDDYLSPLSKQEIITVFKGKQKGRSDFYGDYIEGEWQKVENPKVTSIIKHYPDFGQPENFVMLIEIKNKDGIELCDWVITYAGCFANRKDFLCKLINLLTSKLTASISEVPDIKQQIREAEWKYAN